ncbi:MAG: MMPL family transporter [Deltaproteobacteria bacterium]|nr:MMPL family transporter [Candidatus Anaeroferrophillacea bacterium]
MGEGRIRRRYLRFLFARPWTVLAVLLLLTAGCGFLCTRLPVESSLESLIIERDPDLHFYEQYKDCFGEDEFLVVGFNAPDLFTPDRLAFVRRLTTEFEAIPEVREVLSLTNVEQIFGGDGDIMVAPLIDELPADDAAAAAVGRSALECRFVCGNLVNHDGSATLFLIRTRMHPGDGGYDARLLDGVRAVIDRLPADGPLPPERFHVAGWLVTEVNMSRSMVRDLVRFIPLTYLVLLVLFYWFLRNGTAVVLALANISVALTWTMALLYLVGGSVCPMTAILPPMIMALVASDSVHILTEFLQRDRRTASLPEVMRATVENLWIPCLLTSVTTAAGFASLGISDIPPIRHFGLAAAGGMMAEFMLSVTILPLGVILLRHRPGLRRISMVEHGAISRFYRRLGLRLPALRLPVIMVTLVLAGAAVAGVFSLQVETNLIEYFRHDSRVAGDMRFIDERLGGVNTLEISFRAAERDAFLEPRHLAVVEKTAAFVAGLPSVSRVLTMNDFLFRLNQAFHNDDPAFYRLPENRAMTAQYMLLYGGDELYNFVDRDYRWTRLSARTTEHLSSRLKERIDAIRRFLRTETAASGLDIRVTGKTFLANKLVKRIVDSQVYSLALAAVVVFAIMFAALRSVQLGLLAIVANALPILFNLGLMGLLKIPLNTSSAVISAVAIGIAVDDTIHFLHQYRVNRAAGQPVPVAVPGALYVKGVPMTITSAMLAIAFSILTCSGFVPTAQFGFLSAVIMVTALLCDVLVLPALLMVGVKRP